MLKRNFLTRKAILKCSEADKADFKNSICSLSISVGQPYHEGDKFKATLVAVNENFKECIIVICDSLYRHTMKFASNLSINELHHKANLAGDEWLERNSHAINQLDIPFKITRWDSWLANPGYNRAYENIDTLHRADTDFREALEGTARLFLKRQIGKLNAPVTEQSIFSSSIDYLKEECAGMLLWAESNYQFEIYPNQRNAAMDYVYRNVIGKFNSKLVRAISIKFKNLVPTQLPTQRLVLETIHQAA